MTEEIQNTVPEHIIQKRVALMLSHPKYFLKYACFTQDQQDPDNSCKPFPYADLEYVQRVVELWHEYDKICILKSRQVLLSWTLLACNIWYAFTGTNRDIYIRRTKFDDAQKLLERMQFIYKNIPEIYKKYLPEMTSKEGLIRFEEINTKVYAMASGAEQGLGETPSSLLYDEFAFDIEDRHSFTTMLPAIQGKSKVALISTPCKLFGDRDPYHRKIFEDRLGEGNEAKAAQINEVLEEKPRLQGYREWCNPGNGFICAEIHYTADPAKRTKEWKVPMRSLMMADGQDWDVFMELSWENYTGAGVFTKEFNKDIHVLDERREPDPNYPQLIRGWDFGGNHSCAVFQQVGQKLFLIDEFPNMGYDTRRIGADIQQKCFDLYGPDFHYVEVIDPSGAWEGKTSTGMACKDVMLGLGMEILAGDQDPTRRIDAVMKLLSTNSLGTPNLQINPGCTFSIQGFRGAYHYPEKVTQNQKMNRPVKNDYSHIMDAIQYPATKVGSLGRGRRKGRKMPNPGGVNYKL